MNLQATALLWQAERRPAAVVEVAAAKGSVPRGEGTRMLVSAHDVVGTIGGGHLEWKAIAAARDLLQGRAVAREQHVPLGPALGQCCGGAVTLRMAALDAAELARWPIEPPRFHLQLYGAGHVGRAIVRALAPLHVVVDWIDERDEAFPAAWIDEAPDVPWPDHVRKVCVDSVEAEVLAAPPGAHYLVLTHRHDLDERISEAILARGDFGYFGLIGSKTKRARFIRRFEQRGISPEAIARMTCPIGMPGIDGKEPEVIAAAVVAQLLAQPVRAASHAKTPAAGAASATPSAPVAPRARG